MNSPRHKWVQQDGFRTDKCEHCGLIRYWNSGYGRIMYKKETAEGRISEGPFFWPSRCRFVMITDKLTKM